MRDGIDLFNKKKIGQIIFSQGTYQIEVKDETEVFWPFLQLNDFGQIVDCFCTCEKAENNKSCAHLSAAYYAIYQKKKKPLHLRFQDSFWSHLAQMCSKRHGFETSCLQKSEEKGYYSTSLKDKKLFTIKAFNSKRRSSIRRNS